MCHTQGNAGASQWTSTTAYNVTSVTIVHSQQLIPVNVLSSRYMNRPTFIVTIKIIIFITTRWLMSKSNC